MSYRYTAENRLAEPHRYMYTPYEGPDFLRAYRADRERVLSALAAVDRPAELEQRDAAVLPTRPGEGTFDTLAVLLDLLDRPDPEWTAALLRRFEVTKRLYAGYDAAMKPAQGHFEDIASYALLSIACLDVYAGGGTLKYLNAAIKLGDVLCSADLSAEASLVRWAARRALERELELVDRLLEEQGVSP